MFVPSRRVAYLHVSVLTLVFVAGLPCGNAAEPQFVRRLIVVRDSPAGYPSFEAEESHALVVGAFKATHSLPFGHQNPELIAQLLEANIGDEVDDLELAEISLFIADQLDSSALLSREALFVTGDGAQRWDILWKSGYPTPAATKAGPLGDIRTLGTFSAELADSNSDPIATDQRNKWRITPTPTAAVVEEFSLAIGWFRR